MFFLLYDITKKINNCINLTVTTFWCKLTTIGRAKEFQDKELFVAENVATLNDFIIENIDSANSQTQRSSVEL